MTDNVETLATLLREAANAHHKFEASLGRPDPDWPRWYAQFIYDELHTTAQAVDAMLSEGGRL